MQNENTSRTRQAMDLLEFDCADYRFALPLSSVERVIQAAALSPLPGAPENVLGVLNLHGDMLPVISLVACSDANGLPLSPAQDIIIVAALAFPIGICADRVHGVRDLPLQNVLPEHPYIHSLPFVDGIVWLEEDLCFICDPEKVLLSDDMRLLAQALGRRLNHAPV